MTEEERAAEAERERQHRISELKSELREIEEKIKHFEHVLKVLTDSRLKMTGLKNKLSTEAGTPISTYDIDGSDEWKGLNYTDGKAAYDEVNDQRTAYDSEIGTLDEDIEKGVDKANEKIQELYRQRNSVLSELRSLGA